MLHLTSGDPLCCQQVAEGYYQGSDCIKDPDGGKGFDFRIASRLWLSGVPHLRQRNRNWAEYQNTRQCIKPHGQLVDGTARESSIRTEQTGRTKTKTHCARNAEQNKHMTV